MIGILAGAFKTASRVDGFGHDALRVGSLRQDLSHWFAAQRRHAAEMRTARDLRGMDDALLRDIGLTRDEADQLVRTGRIAEDRG